MVHSLKVKNSRNYNVSGTFTYYFISLKRKQFFSLVPVYYGISLLQTLNPSPEGVHNNGSRCIRQIPWENEVGVRWLFTGLFREHFSLIFVRLNFDLSL